jgi:hypothetical protein
VGCEPRRTREREDEIGVPLPYSHRRTVRHNGVERGFIRRHASFAGKAWPRRRKPPVAGAVVSGLSAGSSGPTDVSGGVDTTSGTNASSLDLVRVGLGSMVPQTRNNRLLWGAHRVLANKDSFMAQGTSKAKQNEDLENQIQVKNSQTSKFFA